MTLPAPSRSYGWIPSRPDYRDLRLAFAEVDTAVLPSRIDLRDAPAGSRSNLPTEIRDQGQLGSCTANMADVAFAYDLAAQYGRYDYATSRLFVYYVERSFNGNEGADTGASIADAAKALNRAGAPPEVDWPYDVSQFATRPPERAFADGLTHAAVRYARVDQSASAVGQCLLAGTPVCIGFTVYTAFEGSDVAATGVLNLPQAGERDLGGHAVLVVGRILGSLLAAELGAKGLDTTRVDPTAYYYIVRNSWGESWGDAGHFYMLEAYLLDSNLASDFWTIQSVSSPAPAPIPVPTPGPTPAPAPSDATTVVLTAAQAAVVRKWMSAPHWWSAATKAAKALKEAMGL